MTIQKGAIGTELRLTATTQAGAVLRLDLADTVRFTLRSPSGVVLDRAATLVGGGSTGIATYTTVSGDLSERGTWRMWLDVTALSGWTGETTYDTFVVADPTV